jgi:ferric-dicitrate binding protein FerR (iron transport regulator)
MNEQIYIIISKELNGEADPAEQRELQAWLEADAENREIYQDMKLLWKDTDVLVKAQPSFNTTAAWDKVSTKISTAAPVATETKAKTIQLRPWVKYMAAAAVLVLGFLITRTFLINDNNVIVAANDQTIVLPDNSTVTLRKGSKLEFPDEFKGDERKVMLDGEAFFEVTRNEQQPFIINAQSATVRVLGTSFNVKCSKEKAVVVVKTGKVRLAEKNGDKKSVDLTPGEKGVLEEGSLSMEKVLTEDYLYWKDGVINFNNRPLYEVTNTLGELYNVAVKLDMSDKQKNQLVNISFNNQQLEDMLTEVCLITQSQWHKANNSYIIRPK